MRPKEKKRGKNWLINSLLVLLFIIGLALIFNNQIRSWFNKIAARTPLAS